MKNKIVLFGGYDSSYKYNNELKIYDLRKSAWTSKALKGESNDIPTPRIEHTANAVGDSIFIIGGMGENSHGDSNVYKIDFDTQKC